MTQTIDFARLCEPFPAARIHWRVGARNSARTRGQALPYIDARDVQNRLDEVVGPDRWRNSFSPGPGGNGACCTIELLINDQWVGKSDCAHQDRPTEGKDYDHQLETAVKGAASTAFKPAAVMWGIGRYLYGFEAPWVALRDERTLARIPTLPDHCLPVAERGAPRPAASPASGPEASTEPPRSVSAARVGDDEPVGETLIGTDAQWRSLTAEQRQIVRGLVARMADGGRRSAIRAYLTTGRGVDALPQGARHALLARLVPEGVAA